MVFDWYNAFHDQPTIPLDGWTDQASTWRRLGAEVGAVSDFNPLTIKALYVMGIINGACRSVTILLGQDNLVRSTYFPAYVIFASVVDILGRCLTGNTTSWAKGNQQSEADITMGFKWLARPHGVEYASVETGASLVTTANGQYSIKYLVALRNFAAHGQGAYRRKGHDKEIASFDYLLLGEMPTLLGDGIEAYLTQLTQDPHLCNALARAKITPYSGMPVLDALMGHVASKDSLPRSYGDFSRRQDWSYKV